MLQSWCTFPSEGPHAAMLSFWRNGFARNRSLTSFMSISALVHQPCITFSTCTATSQIPFNAHETIVSNRGWHWDRNAFSVFTSSLDFKTMFVPIEANSGSIYCCKYRIVYYTVYSSYSSIDSRQFICRWNWREFWPAAKNTPIGPVPLIAALNHACTYSWL